MPAAEDAPELALVLTVEAEADGLLPGGFAARRRVANVAGLLPRVEAGGSV
jgi:hypothetical protein